VTAGIECIEGSAMYLKSTGISLEERQRYEKQIQTIQNHKAFPIMFTPARDFLLETPWRIIIPNPNVNSHSL
jgi:hypothetical protein